MIQQNLSFVNEGYESLGERLKGRAAELKSSAHDISEASKETDAVMTWLKDMKTTAASWNNSDGKDSVKTQLEQQKVLTGLLPLGNFYIFLALRVTCIVALRCSRTT